MRRITRILFIVVGIQALNACASTGLEAQRPETARLDAVMEGLPLASAAKPEAAAIHNAVVSVDDPARGLHYEQGVGPARSGEAATVTPAHQFPIASVTKTMTATIIFQLAEEGKLGPRGIDTRLGELGVFDAAVLDRLDRYEGKSYGADLSLRQLLGHRSGMRDVFMDDAQSTSADHHGDAAPNSFGGVLMAALGDHQTCLRTPGCDVSTLRSGKMWKPWDPKRIDDPDAGVLNFYLSHDGGATNALFAPDAGFHYNDTGYIILGLVIEKVTGGTLHEAYRKRLFDPLGLDHTYLEYAEIPPTQRYRGSEADFYLGDFAGRTGKLNISFDWAGGGVVSTAPELSRFIRALAEGRLFRKHETLETMTATQWREERGGLVIERGLGVSRLTTPDGISYFGHTGFWGAIMIYEPATGISLAGTLNQVGINPASWALDLLRAAHERTPPTP